VGIQVVLAAGAVLGLVQSPAAFAHNGGRVQLYVSHFTVDEGDGASWQVDVTLVDADSGRPAAGMDVVASGTESGGGTFGPVTLTDSADIGRYVGRVSAAAGSWSISVQAKARPGGEAAVPMARAWRVTLAPGSISEPRGAGAVEDTDAGDDHAAGSPWIPGLLLGTAGGVGGVVAAIRWRRRMPVLR
jgi:hypothetical protein